ncbi:SGNH/GDSL hydrolase family protein [Wenzhouxiangella sp. AB-CW3]|uniref:SGNH/GDSL hydrolase family protein n=1 Tax=Wenzhouxiangella sp. AB-CW3 TaxID=2771012 RepID=UPI00168BA986|nr:SGNH/GDSL hydrolase family protein [Wenzhouxiangella sp. AB-CW3]QOC22320.1 SGNH/GDSL hydrolase family protein [Wenzhouxiangella sp. AB-CW3]
MIDTLTGWRVLAALALVGAPAYLLQGRRVKRNTPRLPEAPGLRYGQIDGEQPPLRLLAVGESPLAGVGLDSADQTVIAGLAERLARQSGRATNWSIVARGGVTVADTCDQLLPQIPERSVDLVLIGLGVNDCLQLTGARGWQAGLATLFDGLTERCQPGRIVLSGVPPMQHFPALPQPLAGMLGLRARMLDAASAELAASRSDVIHAPMNFDGRSQELFCHDGFHPGVRGHQLWAEQLTELLAGDL